MLANRRTDTKPELALRRALHRRGLRYRKDYRIDLPGHRVRADIVFTRARLAVFVDGCFWHRCPVHGTDPKSNAAYWAPKLRANVLRDLRTDAALAASGWSVVRVWEHEDPDDAAERVGRAIHGGLRPVSVACTRADGPRSQRVRVGSN
jgi:DNA mismatch endonuclease (patch repair protein)